MLGHVGTVREGQRGVRVCVGGVSPDIECNPGNSNTMHKLISK